MNEDGALLNSYKNHIKDALAQMDKHLKWNPTDTLGVRFLVEDTCSKAGITHIKHNKKG